MNLFALSGLIGCITSFITAIFSWFKAKKLLHKLWAIFNLSVAIWGISAYKFSTTLDKETVFFWLRFGHIGVVLIPVLFLHVIFEFLEIRKKKLLYLIYAIGTLFIILNITDWLGRTKLFIVSLRYVFNSFYVDSPPGAVYPLFVAFFFIVVIYAHYLGIKYLRVSTGLRRLQIKYFVSGMALSFAGGATAFPMVFGIDVYPYLHFTVFLYPIIMTYAIYKYRLMDINIALTRAGIFAVVYTLVLGLPLGLTGFGKFQLQGLFGDNWYWAPIILAIIFATTGPYMFLFLQRHAEKIIRKEQFAYQQALRETSSTMMLNKDLDKLLKSIVLNVVDIVKANWAGIYLKNEKQREYILKHSHSKITGTGLPKEFNTDSELINRLYKSKLPLIGEEIHSQELKIGLAIPCFLDNDMIGFLLLGDKPKGKIYDQSDVNEFTLLSNQTALAIENCQFYSQERQHHHYLRVASLDRQMAGMAHEIENPNQALLSNLGSLEMALDDLKDIIPQDKMERMKYKISRARFNSGRISSMISAVRNFSLPTTGEQKAVKLEWITNDFFIIMNPQFKYHAINFSYELPQEAVWLKANKIEIEQVLVNLGINSIQAINEIWQAGQNTTESKKEIAFKAYKIDSKTLRIDFSDTGSGIKKELLEDIFLDFVTTKASSVGTGLGLSISRKHLQKHRGRIWAESEGENKGAAFHIELPIPNDITEEDRKIADESQEKNKKEIFRQDSLDG